MRELERDAPSDTPARSRLAIIGQGRVGKALAAALDQYGRGAFDVALHGRGADGAGYDAVLLCVPDAELSAAAAAIAPGSLVGHCSGASSLEAVAPHEAFSLHPLMTFSGGQSADRFAGTTAAVAGTTRRALAYAVSLARTLSMQPVQVAEEDRALYHAAASVASNFLLTLEGTAERLAALAGVEREALVPLVRATVDNWALHGAERSLTGPVARGDQATVERQREAAAEHAPELMELFEVLISATRDLANAARQPA